MAFVPLSHILAVRTRSSHPPGVRTRQNQAGPNVWYRLKESQIREGDNARSRGVLLIQPAGATVSVVARKVLIVGLVLLLILLIIPIGIGMVMGPCPECPAGGAPMLAAICLILLATEILVLAMALLTGIMAGVARQPRWVLVRGIERPPRSS